jgi:hypothetical protein
VGWTDRFRKKKEVEIAKKEGPSLLEKLCYEVEGLSKEEQTVLYKDLSTLLFLDPTKINSTYENTVKSAIDFERAGNINRAKINRRIAASLAFYNGNKNGAIDNLMKYTELAKIKTAEEVPLPAQELYKMTLEHINEAFWVAEQLYSKTKKEEISSV